MSQWWQKICVSYKQQLISNDPTIYIKAIVSIRECLTRDQDERFAKVLVDFDIHEFLLQRLSSNNTVNIHILKCIEQLCMHKIFFSHDYAVDTAEFILKSIYYYTKNNNDDDFLQLGLHIISIIIKNLNNYCSAKTLIFIRYIQTAKELLLSKQNKYTICATINMISELFTYNLFQTFVNENINILTIIYELWQLSLHTLSKMREIFANESILTVSTLCHHILRFSKVFTNYKVNGKIPFSSKIIEDCINVIKFVCIPFVNEFGFPVNGIYVEYLYFLHVLLHSDLQRKEIQLICNVLVTERNFIVIVKYLEHSVAFFKKLEDFNHFKQLYLNVVSEIIMNFNDFNDICYINEQNKNYLMVNLQNVIQDHKKWFHLLLEPNINKNVKLSVIKLCCLCYVHSNNSVDNLQIEDFKAFIIFVKDFSFPNIDIYFVKDLWLLYAYTHCLFIDENSFGYILFKATINLQKLLILLWKAEPIDKIISSHYCILDWVFTVPYVQKKIKYAVLYYWIKNLHQFDHNILFGALKKYPTLGCTLLGIIKYGNRHLSEIASEILQKALKNGYLMEDPRFVEKLSISIPYFISDLSSKQLIEEIVVRSIYMFHLASYNKMTINTDLLEYSVNIFTKSVGKLGISEIFPSVFYTTAFKYITSILIFAKNNRIFKVFNLFISSESILHTFMSALHSEKEELSDKAGNIFYVLLEYQQDENISDRKCSVIFKVNTLIKIMSAPKNNRLEVNLQIAQKLLRTTSESILNTVHPLSEKFLKGLYVRCLCLISKPENLHLSNYALKCMKDILKYSFKYRLQCRNYFWKYPGNLNLIMIFCQKNIPRSIEKDLLSYINCLLRFAVENKTLICDNNFVTLRIWKLILTQILYLINKNYEQTENKNLIVNICRQLMVFCGLLNLPSRVSLQNFVINMQ